MKTNYRKLMESHLGRKLLPNEVVHHINGDHSDNRIENLKVLLSGEHSREHKEGKHHSQAAKDKMREAYKNGRAKSPGRPRIHAEGELKRGSYRVPTRIIDVLRNAGKGNICLGIIRVTEHWTTTQEASADSPNPTSAEE